MFRVILSIFFAVFTYANECVSCHNVEKFEPINHDFDCKECHVLPKHRDNFKHENIITHPTSAKNVEIFCIKCHEQTIKSYKSSNHFTHKNEIKFIYKAFGIDTNHTIQTLPKVDKISDLKSLVTDMARRKCLRCHTENQHNYEANTYRGVGCMACHIEYDKHGTYNGTDALMSGKKPYAKAHKMAKKPPLNACLTCHNKNFTGTEYLGLFPKDHDKSYRAPLDELGRHPLKSYGIDFHHLSKDVHFVAKLECADCHNTHKNEPSSCISCHTPKPNEAHQSYHKNVSCTACHAAWQVNYYELSLLRDDTKNYKMWENLHVQEDGYVENFLNKSLKRPNLSPKMPDFISGEMRDGVWYSGYRFKRWENFILANSQDGKIELFRPMFEYRISYKDKNGKVVFDDVGLQNGVKFQAFLPTKPHTIGKNAKSCEACHENNTAYKMIQNNTAQELINGKKFKGSNLTDEQIRRLGSDFYKKTRAKMIFGF